MNRQNTVLIVAGHLLFWLFNYALIAFGMELDWNGFVSPFGSLAYAYAYGLFFNAILFYVQVFWLVPKLYRQNKKLKFHVISFTIIIVISIIESYFDSILHGIYKIYIEDAFVGSFIGNTTINLLYSTVGFYYIFKLEYKKSEKIKQQILEETYKTELKYLKAQLNPHFLFNGINSVYHLIGKNDVLAKETLLQFSGLLRYQLYESETHISLEKELGYVSQYIKIEETRKGSDIQLQYDIKFENPDKKIAPLLLIPFIENAFKHCSHHTDDFMNIIHIKIIEIGGTLTLNVTNSFDASLSEGSVGGIGLSNVKRRLPLVYPDQYQLEIRREKTNFIVDLIINL